MRNKLEWVLQKVINKAYKNVCQNALKAGWRRLFNVFFNVYSKTHIAKQNKSSRYYTVASSLGAGGPRFESWYPDSLREIALIFNAIFCLTHNFTHRNFDVHFFWRKNELMKRFIFSCTSVWYLLRRFVCC